MVQAQNEANHNRPLRAVVSETRAARRRHSLLVPLARMGSVGLWGYRLHDDGHEAMESATELGALAIEDALALDEAVDAPWGRVCLHAQSGNGEAVQHILPSDQKADVSSRRQSQTLINLEITHHAGLQVLV